MLNDVDRSLRSLLEAVVATADTGDAPPTVSFEPPTADWAEEQGRPVINLFLYDIREYLDGQSSDEIDIRNDEGKVIGRLPPPRKYELSYLASAWCGDAEIEHELLGLILATVPDEPGIPADFLTGRLAEQGLPVRIKVATPVSGAGTWDLWSALGTPPRTAVEIVVTAPLVPALRTDLAPPAERLDLGVSKEPPGAIGAGEPGPNVATDAEEVPAKPATAKPKRAKGPPGGPTGKDATEDETPEPDLVARPGKRWTTFRVREQAIPMPASD